ncbi:MAG: hypothetical protein J2P17_03925 [Mycobacterium sp.]|nr:hypothetical protein [Mycobacterium sp.]
MNQLKFNWARQVLLPGGRRRMWVAVGAVLAAVCVSSGVYLAVSSNGTNIKGNSAALERPTAAASTPTNPASTATASPAAVVADPAKQPLTPAHKATVAAWSAGRGGAAVATVSAQLGYVLQEHGLRQFIQMKQSCARLSAAVSTARANAPIPDGAMQRLYGKALTDLAEGAADCRAAISGHREDLEDIEVRENAPLLQRALTAFAAGADYLYRATANIKVRAR